MQEQAAERVRDMKKRAMATTESARNEFDNIQGNKNNVQNFVPINQSRVDVNALVNTKMSCKKHTLNCEVRLILKKVLLGNKLRTKCSSLIFKPNGLTLRDLSSFSVDIKTS